MEGLAPPLKCLIEIQSALQNAETVQKGVHRYLQHLQLTGADDDFAPILRRFVFAWDQGQDWRCLLTRCPSSYRRALIELIATGFSGQPILPNLLELKAEIIDACELEIRHHLELLPIYMLGPLLFFQFPAFLLLLFGPLLTRLLQELSR